ncbi:MAG: dTDP-glucose 4,6-dehydratase [Candidatus Omnitrophota bacterium]
MRKRIPKILVTGGAGFIGSAFVRQLIMGCPRSTKGLSPQEAISKNTKGTVPEVVVIDKLTYAGDLKRLEAVKGRYDFYKTDICDEKRIKGILKKERPEAIVNFAAETHVDRSILDSKEFLRTNIAGTQNLLDISRRYKIKKFVHISTDEVYGDIKKGRFHEDSPLKPNSPYAASKAAADLLIKSYIRTYDFPAVIIRPSNNYGPWQFPEKLIPVIINNAVQNRRVPVYAKGLNMREWLYVSDCADAVIFLLKKAKTGEIYNLGSGHHEKNIDVVKRILKILRKPYALIEFVRDRPGHDFRYALDSSKIRKLGWRPKISFSRGLEMTVAWNVANRRWLKDKGL